MSGKTIDELWNLGDRKNRHATWRAFYVPNADKDHDKTKSKGKDSSPTVVPFSGKSRHAGKAGTKKLLAITDGYESDSLSLPSLATVSDSSDEDIDLYSDEDDASEYESDTESEFDAELKAATREQLRQAWDMAQADPDFHNPRVQANHFEEIAAAKMDNPFVRLLGSLRGGCACVDRVTLELISAQVVS